MLFIKCLIMKILLLVPAYCYNSTNMKNATMMTTIIAVGLETNATGDGRLTHESNKTILPTKTERRRVLIVNLNLLRDRKISSTANHLLFQEFDKNGEKLYEFHMKNLDDVATFFENYLDTKICHGYC